MNQSPQTGKRIVTKDEYVKVQARRLSGWLRTGYCFGSALFVVGLIVLKWHHNHHAIKTFAGFFLLVAAVIMYCAGRLNMQQVRAIESVALLTRANTADLPAPDILVRASEQPRPEQESILLRSAAESAQTPPEQLLRSVER